MTDVAIAEPVKGNSAFITGLGVAQICSWGSLYYSFPLIAAAMETELGWSKTDLYLGATIGILLSALVAVPVGAAIDRGHGRWVMAAASFVAGSCCSPGPSSTRFRPSTSWLLASGRCRRPRSTNRPLR